MKTIPPGSRTVLLMFVIGVMLLAQMWRALRWRAQDPVPAQPASFSTLRQPFPSITP